MDGRATTEKIPFACEEGRAIQERYLLPCEEGRATTEIISFAL
jgi:hypothetical protein